MQSSSASAVSHADSSSLSSDNENKASILSSSNILSTVAISSYTLSQLKRLLNTDKQNFTVIKNESRKNLPTWWRSFVYPAILNDKNQFERITGYKSCFKCYQAFHYGSSTGTKRFLSHADRCFPSASSSSSTIWTDNSNLFERSRRRKTAATTDRLIQGKVKLDR